MQLTDLYQDLRTLTDEQLKERLQTIRHNRTVERPAAKAHAKKAAKKGTTSKMTSAQALLAALGPEELKQMLLALNNGEE